MKMTQLLSIWLTLFSILSGCARLQTTVSHQKAPSNSTRAPDEATTIANLLGTVRDARKFDYKLSPADLLEISVYRQDDLKRTVRISQQGTISFPLVGVVSVVGLSTIDAENILATRLADFYVSPQISIFVKEYANKQIYVLGEVQKPGAYELPTESQLTVLEAISLAGGFTPVAAKDGTKVIRSATDGSNSSVTIEVTAITQRGEKSKDISLSPNDVVFVPQSFF